jgi:hypothetical protein
VLRVEEGGGSEVQMHMKLLWLKRRARAS